MARAKQGTRKRHGRWLGGAQAHATGHGARQGFSLRDLEVERDSFCRLTVAEMAHWRWATTVWLGRSRSTSAAYSGAPPAPRNC
jgi:hypothetical protein